MNTENAEQLASILSKKAGLKCPYCGTKGSVTIAGLEHWVGTIPQLNTSGTSHYPVISTVCNYCGHIDFFNPKEFYSAL